MLKLPGSILNVSLFGSAVRGDCDESSDIDVLVVVKDGSGKANEDEISSVIKAEIGKEPSISWYGKNRLTEMFNEGHLFSWHLHLESAGMCGFESLSKSFDAPQQYRMAYKDISDLIDLAETIIDEVTRRPNNSVYELGIAYVCARNIAMSASWHFCAAPDFSRSSPFNIAVVTFPISLEAYRRAMASRHAGQRGRPCPASVSSDEVIDFCLRMKPWYQAILENVSNYES